MPKFQTVRGMRDFLPSDAEKLRHVEAVTKEVARLYGFEEIITPLVEYYDLLAAKSGEEIKARLYAFNDLAGRKVALRPEFTASIARLMATTLRNEPKPLRLFSTGTLYRYDEPQFGRYREFWQSNFEIIGSSKPEADIEVLALTNHLMQKLGLRNYRFKIGHVGILRGVLFEEGVKDEEQNIVMQLLDTKRWDEALGTARGFGVSEKGIMALKEIFEAKGKDGSRVLTQVKKKLKEYASSVAAVENLQQIIGLCKEGGIKFDMSIEARFARGLEYYTGMIFEPLVPEMEISLGGGGRYDKLVEMFGGESTPAVGVAHGLDRIALAIDKQNVAPESSKKIVAVIPIGEKTVPKAMELALRLRKKGVAAELEVMRRSISRALQDADRRKVAHAVILGPKELKERKVMLRDMKNRQQHLVDIEDVFKLL
ncbi:MAG: histidine--tRNA ligase [Candidatus Bathyarchaeota archaeon]|nr:histidine--tRNA ligase [Candidatus Bathyarchaeota archaeon]MDH5494802.1 histidine--tRNA ligase [Candidatus Bathyarchaeota archaeon]